MTLAGKKILVVDDDDEIVGMLRQSLLDEGCKVVTAQNGTQAASLIRSEKFDGMLLDIKLPGMSGLQVAAVSKSSDKNAKMPIIIISGALDADVIAKAKNLGIVDLVVKPFSTDAVHQKLETKFESDQKDPKTYDVRVINCFLSAVQEILQFYLETPPALGKPVIKIGTKCKGYVSGVIGLSGDGIVGSSSITFERALLHVLAKKVFMDPEITLTEEICGDLAGELCNQICGKVKVNFAKLGIRINIGLPEVVIGEHHVLVHKTNNPIISIPVQHSGSTCVAEFNMVTNIDKKIDESKAEESAKGVVIFDA